jgi:hypothetical protein
MYKRIDDETKFTDTLNLCSGHGSLPCGPSGKWLDIQSYTGPVPIVLCRISWWPVCLMRRLYASGGANQACRYDVSLLPTQHIASLEPAMRTREQLINASPAMENRSMCWVVTEERPRLQFGAHFVIGTAPKV